MPADGTTVSLRPETAEAPATRRDAPRAQPERPAEVPSAPEKAARSPRRRSVRWALLALLPLALVAGAYWYVTGGQVMSTDNAYVAADQVGISTDVSGIVQTIAVADHPGDRGPDRSRRAGSPRPRSSARCRKHRSRCRPGRRRHRRCPSTSPGHR